MIYPDLTYRVLTFESIPQMMVMPPIARDEREMVSMCSSGRPCAVTWGVPGGWRA
jgi:hypothetical protein